MAVAETASSCTKSTSSTAKTRRKSSKCFKTSKDGQFHLSKVPLAQWIRARPAPKFIVFANTVGGKTILITAGQDITVKGSSVIADKALEINAAGNITLEAATNKSSNTSFSQSKESGLLSGGSGLSISIGNIQQSTDQKGQTSSAAASTVGSVTGNVQLTAGQSFKQVGSDIITLGLGNPAGGGNTNITAKQVEISEARQSASSATEQKFKQSGLTLSISNPVLSAAQGA